jgi:hypothetical protein
VVLTAVEVLLDALDVEEIDDFLKDRIHELW